MSANFLKRQAFPSMTGLPASGPMLPRPSTAVPLVTTATRLPRAVYSQPSSALAAISRHGSATPGEYASDRSRCVTRDFVGTTSIFPGRPLRWYSSASFLRIIVLAWNPNRVPHLPRWVRVGRAVAYPTRFVEPRTLFGSGAEALEAPGAQHVLVGHRGLRRDDGVAQGTHRVREPVVDPHLEVEVRRRHLDSRAP